MTAAGFGYPAGMRVRPGLVFAALATLAAWVLLRAFPVAVGDSAIVTAPLNSSTGLFGKARSASSTKVLTGPDISVTTRVIAGPADVLDPLLAALPRPTGGEPADERVRPSVIGTPEMNTLIRAAQADASPASSVLTAPRVTIRSGQPAFAVVASQQAYVAAIEGLEPKVETAQSGVLFQVRPAVSATVAGGVHVEFVGRLDRLHGLAVLPHPDAPPGSALPLHRVDFRGSAVESAFTLPPGGVAVFVMPEPPGRPGGGPTTRPVRSVYLISADVAAAGSATTRPAR